MKWILLLIAGTMNPSVSTQEFDSLRACNDARTVIMAQQNITIGPTVQAYCFQKDK